MSASGGMRAVAFAVLAIAFGFLGCSTTDDPAVFDDIGTTRIVLIDPALAAQSIIVPGKFQIVEWTVTEATLDLEGFTEAIDLLGGDTCLMLDSSLTSPAASGNCSRGITLENDDGTPREARVHLRFSMTLRRAAPFYLIRNPEDPGKDPDLTPDGDDVLIDGDLSGSAFDNPCSAPVLGCDDNCPLADNPSQQDSNGDGVGDACVVNTSLGVLLDSDADGVADIGDNCVAKPNNDQAPAGDYSLIGAACGEQVASAHLNGSTDIELDLGPVDALLPRGGVSYLVVDLNNARTVACNWPFPFCSLDPTQVRFCASNSVSTLTFGCPIP